MPAQCKRKHTAVDDQPATKQSSSAKKQKTINAFANVGKQHRIPDVTKQRKDEDRTTSQPKSQKKRKRNTASDSDAEDESTTAAPPAKHHIETPTHPVSTPRNKRVKNMVARTPAETPSGKAAALFDRLKIDANSRAIPCPLTSTSTSYNTPPDTPPREKQSLLLSFPPELEDLQDLHSAFLAALSLYYSHNGSSSSVDLSALLPRVTNHWKKRAVKLEDLQRMFAIVPRADQSFSLQRFGAAGVRLVRDDKRGRASKSAGTYIDEEEMNNRFEEALQKSWLGWQASTPQENRTVAAFLAQLPVQEIVENESVQSAAPLFARGQQRLADLKASKSLAKPATASASPEQQSTQIPAQATQSRGTALLDRILAKQRFASTLPTGPTSEQLARRSALYRIEDVARILSLLAGTKDRCSYSIPTITQQLQQSLRNPISSDEIERCLNLMSSEIIPGFVKVVQSGEIRGVVIARSFNIGLADLRARVAQALT